MKLHIKTWFVAVVVAVKENWKNGTIYYFHKIREIELSRELTKLK
jgi:hypothetical protein